MSPDARNDDGPTSIRSGPRTSGEKIVAGTTSRSHEPFNDPTGQGPKNGGRTRIGDPGAGTSSPSSPKVSASLSCAGSLQEQ